MKRNHFLLIISIIFLAYLGWYYACYLSKTAQTSDVKSFKTSVLTANKSIKTFKVGNILSTPINYFKHHYTITGTTVTFRQYPEHPLSIGKIIVKQFTPSGFDITLNDVTINKLNSLIKVSDDIDPMLNTEWVYDANKKTLTATITIYNKLRLLETDTITFHPVTLRQPMPLNLDKTNAWFQAVKELGTAQVRVMKTKDLTEKQQQWAALIPSIAKRLFTLSLSAISAKS